MFIVGPIEPEEVAAVARLAAKALSDGVAPEWVAGAAAIEPENVLVAREYTTNEVVGFALSERTVACEGQLLALAVSRFRRGEGIGSALISGVRDRMVREGVYRLGLSVRADDARAQDFYRRHGFAPGGLERHAYSDGADAVLLFRPL